MSLARVLAPLRAPNPGHPASATWQRSHKSNANDFVFHYDIVLSLPTVESVQEHTERINYIFVYFFYLVKKILNLNGEIFIKYFSNLVKHS